MRHLELQNHTLSRLRYSRDISAPDYHFDTEDDDSKDRANFVKEGAHPIILAPEWHSNLIHSSFTYVSSKNFTFESYNVEDLDEFNEAPEDTDGQGEHLLTCISAVQTMHVRL